jgi:biotin carboxyl carrier protein
VSLVRYRVTLGGSESVAVDIEELPTGTLSARVDGRSVQLDVAHVGATLSVRFDGLVVDLTTRSPPGAEPPAFVLAGGGLRGLARVEGDRASTVLQGRPQAKSGPKHVRSPMHGRVAAIAVQAGDAVEAGQMLLVIEAMKMENEVFAHSPGTVLEVHVSQGTAVEAGAALVTLK